MPPRHAYWTILVDDQPTAFRAHDAEELLPTLNRLKEKNPSAIMKWFERGQLFDSRDAARDAGGGEGERRWEGPRPGDDGQREENAARDERRTHATGDAARPPRRGKTWRPGGEHKDPRQKYIDAKKAKWDRFKQNVRDRADRRDARASVADAPALAPQSFSPPHGDPLRDQIDDATPIAHEDRVESPEAPHVDGPSRPQGDKLRDKTARPERSAGARPEWRPREDTRERRDNDRGGAWQPKGPPRDRPGGDWRDRPPAGGDGRGGDRNRESRDGGGGGDRGREPSSRPWQGPPRDRGDRGGGGGWRPSGPPRDDRGGENRDSRGGGGDRSRGPSSRPWSGPPRDRDDRSGAGGGWRPSGPPREDRGYQNRDSRGGGDDRRGGWRPSGPARDRDDRGGPTSRPTWGSTESRGDRPWQNRDSRGGGDDRGGGPSSRPWQGPPSDRGDRGGSSGGWRPSGPPRDRDHDRGRGPSSDRPWQNRDSRSGGGFGDRKPAGGFGQRPWESRGTKPSGGSGPRKPWGAKPGGGTGARGGFSQGAKKPWSAGPGNRPPAGDRPPKRRRDEDE